ncbi:hypothetical protein RFI_12480 [Reticulomyxa filosa]|uniref:Uncharacterized protein n=1 Tax=Reticulomyxa filosa TaxID=46433 RepID=X6NFA7_RETFI|nr:hypothetical protein RFI_12480 [Reticulomyxa filosa]|eukprot:ETO24676.1 hypothetical protein RFI_12480 [Reticulomyxa filosa]
MSNQQMEDQNEDTKAPSYSLKIHHHTIPGSFIFRKNGRNRIDQVLRGYCLHHQCTGVLECKINLHFVNPKSIKYDATEKGFHIDTTQDGRRKYDLFIEYPQKDKYGREIVYDLSDLKNMEATFFNGVLSCRLPVIEIKAKKVKKRKFSEFSKEEIGDSNKPTASNKKSKVLSKKSKKKLATEAEDENKNEEAVAIKKPGKPELSVTEQTQLADEIVNKIEKTLKEKHEKAAEKDKELMEYLDQKNKRKLMKEKKKELAKLIFQNRQEKNKRKRLQSALETMTENTSGTGKAPSKKKKVSFKL